MATSRYGIELKKDRYEYMSRLLSVLDLGFEKGSSKFNDALTFSMNTMYNHNFLDAQRGKIRSRILNLGEKLLLHGNESKSRRLLELAGVIINEDLFVRGMGAKSQSVISSMTDMNKKERSSIVNPISILSLLLSLYDPVPEFSQTQPLNAYILASNFQKNDDSRKEDKLLFNDSQNKRMPPQSCNSDRYSSVHSVHSMDTFDVDEGDKGSCFKDTWDQDFRMDEDSSEDELKWGIECSEVESDHEQSEVQFPQSILKYTSNFSEKNDCQLPAAKSEEVKPDSTLDNFDYSDFDSDADLDSLNTFKDQYVFGTSCISLSNNTSINDEVIQHLAPKIITNPLDKKPKKRILISKPEQLYPQIHRCSEREKLLNQEQAVQITEVSLVPEAEIVMSVLQMMQGLSSTIFTLIKPNLANAAFGTFSINPLALNVNVLHLSPDALRGMLELFLKMANSAALLREFVQSVQTDTTAAIAVNKPPRYGTVINSFVGQVELYMMEFEHRMAILERQLYRAQRGEKGEYVSTLIGLKSKIHQDSKKVQFLAKILNEAFPTWLEAGRESSDRRRATASLLNALHLNTQSTFLVGSSVVDTGEARFPTEDSWMLYLFFSSLKLYLHIMDSWITYGQLKDSLDETFLCSSDPTDNMIQIAGTSIFIDPNGIPDFLRGISKSIALAGQDMTLARTLKYEHTCHPDNTSSGWYYTVNQGVSKALEYYFPESLDEKNMEKIGKKRKFSSENQFLNRVTKLRSLEKGNLEMSNSYETRDAEPSLSSDVGAVRTKSVQFKHFNMENVRQSDCNMDCSDSSQKLMDDEIFSRRLSAQATKSNQVDHLDYRKIALHELKPESSILFSPPCKLSVDHLYENQKKEMQRRNSAGFGTDRTPSNIFKDDIFIREPGRNSITSMFEQQKDAFDMAKQNSEALPSLDFSMNSSVKSMDNNDLQKIYRSLGLTLNMTEAPKSSESQIFSAKSSAPSVDALYAKQVLEIQKKRSAFGLNTDLMESSNVMKNQAFTKNSSAKSSDQFYAKQRDELKKKQSYFGLFLNSPNSSKSSESESNSAQNQNTNQIQNPQHKKTEPKNKICTFHPRMAESVGIEKPNLSIAGNAARVESSDNKDKHCEESSNCTVRFTQDAQNDVLQRSKKEQVVDAILAGSQWDDDWDENSNFSTDSELDEDSDMDSIPAGMKYLDIDEQKLENAPHEAEKKENYALKFSKQNKDIQQENRRTDGFFSGTGQIAYDPSMIDKRELHPFFCSQKHPLDESHVSTSVTDCISLSCSEQESLIEACAAVSNIRSLPPTVIMEKALFRPLREHFEFIGQNSVRHLLGDMGLLPLISCVWNIMIGQHSRVLDSFHKIIFENLIVELDDVLPELFEEIKDLTDVLHQSIMSSNPTGVVSTEANIIEIVSHPLPAMRKSLLSLFQVNIESVESLNYGTYTKPNFIDWVRISCEFPSPYNCILTTDVMRDYDRIRSLFSQISYTLYCVHEAHSNALKLSRQYDRSEGLFETFRKSRSVLYKMLQFLMSLQTYMCAQTVPTYWSSFVEDAKNSNSIRNLSELHRKHLNEMLKRVFLDELHRDLLKNLIHALSTCITFVKFLNMFDAAISKFTPNQGPYSIKYDMQNLSNDFFGRVMKFIEHLKLMAETEMDTTADQIIIVLTFNDYFNRQQLNILFS